MLRWGLLGTARINRALIPALRSASRVELVAVASRERARAVAYAREWHIPRAFGSYEEMLTSSEVDVIYNALPNSLHAEWTVRACEAGKHVLCEKPLALSVSDAERIEVAARRHNRVVTEAFMYRHHPQTHRVRELITQGVVGPVQAIKASFTFLLTNSNNVRLNAQLGGGCLWDLGCYPVSWARATLAAEPTRAFGWARWTAGGVDELFVGQLLFPGDVPLVFNCGFTAPFRTDVEIVGRDGLIRLTRPFKPPVDGAIELVRGEHVEQLTTASQELYLGEVNDLTSAALDGTPPLISLADSTANTAALVALLNSARMGQPMPIERS